MKALNIDPLIVAKRDAEDESIPLGLAWWKAYAIYCKADDKRDELEAQLRDKHPPYPSELEMGARRYLMDGITWYTSEDVRTVAGFLAQAKPRKPRGPKGGAA
jgi:hypothetical protein